MDILLIRSSCESGNTGLPAHSHRHKWVSRCDDPVRGMGSGSNHGEIPVCTFRCRSSGTKASFSGPTDQMWSIYRIIMSFNPSAKEFQHVLTLSVMCNVSKTLWLQMRACVRAARSIQAIVDAGKRNFKWPLFVVNFVHRHQRLLTCMKLCIFSSLMC